MEKLKKLKDMVYRENKLLISPEQLESQLQQTNKKLEFIQSASNFLKKS